MCECVCVGGGLCVCVCVCVYVCVCFCVCVPVCECVCVSVCLCLCLCTCVCTCVWSVWLFVRVQQTNLKRGRRRVSTVRSVGSSSRATAVVLDAILEELANACVWNVAAVLHNKHELENAVKHTETFRTVCKRYCICEEKVELLSG